MAYLDRIEERTESKLTRREFGVALAIAVVTALLLGVIFAAQLAIFTPRQPDAVEFAAGRASPVTILAPAQTTFASELDTAQARAQAARAIPDVYDPPDPNIAREQVRRAARIIDFLGTVRSDPYISPQSQVEWVQALPALQVSPDVVSRTLALDASGYRQVISETLYVIDATMREEIRDATLTSAKNRVPSRISLVLSASQSDLVKQWAVPFIVPNTKLNQAETDRARQTASGSVGEVFRTLREGEAVVRAGEVITPRTLEALAELGYLQPGNDSREYIAGFLFAVLVVSLGATYLARIAPPLLRQPRVMLILSFLLLMTALGTKILGPAGSGLQYLFPYAAAAMLGAALLSVSVGAGMAIIVALSTAYITRGSVDMTVFVLVGSLIAAIGLLHRERLTSFLVTGLYVATANVAIVLIFGLLMRQEDYASLARIALAAFGGGVFTGLIALGSQFLLGKAAGITTALELIELSRPTHPLLEKILRQAPGTYHHSLIISNLAEHAAKQIGADALLCRVGAYYHDVGKTLNPQFFVENQFDGINPHNTIDPRVSAKILHDHVSEGDKLARKYHVSLRVRDIILQHHGTTLPVYFFEKAQAQSPGTPLDENEFRYPGPRPQTREAALMMLADGVEATTRAERPSNTQEIRAIIDRIINARIHDGQLDQADLTLRDLEQIRTAFLDVLQGLYHPRVKYPSPKLPAPLPANVNAQETVAEL
ncbi:MAG: HDIG domain-containing protein [Anaerolineae bacterium]|nr:HDIG domain-containing protein [Anaerolineae bacterium]